MNPEPLVSIIIPTFNRANLLTETLNSVINQTYQNWECIIVDDGSTDGTDQIIANFFNIDSRIKYFNRPDTIKRGGNGARNFGFMQSAGDYIKWLDSDDLLEKDILLREFELINNFKHDLVISSWQSFNTSELLQIENRLTNAKPTNGYDLIKILGKFSTYAGTGSYSVKRELIFNSGLWNEGLKLNQDGEFFVRLCLSAKSVAAIEKVGVFFRVDNANKITTNYTFEHYEHRLRSWCLIKAHLEAFDHNLFSEYLKVNMNSMYFYLSNNYKWKLITKYEYLFKENIKEMPTYKIYLIRIKNRISAYFKFH